MDIAFVLDKKQKDLIQLEVKMAINSAVESNAAGKYLGREFLRMKEAAEYLGITTTTLTKFTKMGLSVSVIDGTKLISKQNIKEFVETFEQ